MQRGNNLIFVYVNYMYIIQLSAYYLFLHLHPLNISSKADE